MLAYCFGRASESTESLNEDIAGDPVYRNNSLGRIQEGLLFHITGKIVRNGDRFTIDLGVDNAYKDIALRVAARVSTNTIGRNSRIKKIWGGEETDSVIPFCLKCDRKFDFQVLMTVDNIFIGYNGLHIAKYAHRVPFHEINYLEIHGDIRDVHVDKKIVTGYPIRPENTPHVARLRGDAASDSAAVSDGETGAESETSAEDGGLVEPFLPLPYYAAFDKGFFEEGYSITVKGTVRANAHIFKVSLQAGQNIWPQPAVGLLMEFQFTKHNDGETGEPMVVRNSFTDGKWTGEIKSELATGLRPGANFNLKVMRGKYSFEIYMNDKPLTDYPYKLNPKYVDTCFISGDIKLYDVEMENDYDEKEAIRAEYKEQAKRAEYKGQAAKAEQALQAMRAQQAKRAERVEQSEQEEQSEIEEIAEQTDQTDQTEQSEVSEISDLEEGTITEAESEAQ